MQGGLSLRSLAVFLLVSVVDGFLVKGLPFHHHKVQSATEVHSSSATAMSEVKVGDKIPSLVMMEGLGGFENQEVNIAELIAGKKVAIFGLPGAFTPGTSHFTPTSFLRQGLP